MTFRITALPLLAFAIFQPGTLVAQSQQEAISIMREAARFYHSTSPRAASERLVLVLKPTVAPSRVLGSAAEKAAVPNLSADENTVLLHELGAVAAGSDDRIACVGEAKQRDCSLPALGTSLLRVSRPEVTGDTARMIFHKTYVVRNTETGNRGVLDGRNEVVILVRSGAGWVAKEKRMFAQS